RKSCLLVALIAAPICAAQLLTDRSTQSGGVDCSDPFQSSTPACNPSQGQSPVTGAGKDYSSPAITTPVLRSSPGSGSNPPEPAPVNPSQVPQRNALPRAETEFQQLVADSVGRVLPLFG